MLHTHQGIGKLITLSLVLGALPVFINSNTKAQAATLPSKQMSGTISKNQTWTPNNVYVIDGVTIAKGVKIIIQPGTTVKYADGASNMGLYVSKGASLVAQGTSKAPINFTSFHDDTAGGDTDKGTTKPRHGDYGYALLGDGNINVSHARIQYAYYAFGGGCGTDATPVTAIIDSQLRSAINDNCSDSKLTLKRNTFSVPAGPSLALSGKHKAGVIFSGSDANKFNGKDAQRVVQLASVSVDKSESWTWDSAHGAVFQVSDLAIAGDFRLSAGTIIKVDYSANGFNILDGGRLLATGSASNKVQFTSFKDDNIAGDSNNDGKSVGARADYGRVVFVQKGGTLGISFANISFAYEAVEASGGNTLITDTLINNVENGITAISGKVTFRGTFRDYTMGVRGLCFGGYDVACVVDAGYSDWGNAKGPFISNTKSLVCGDVLVQTWLNGSAMANGRTWADSCEGLGSSGQQQPYDSGALASAAQDFNNSLKPYLDGCAKGYEDYCEVANIAKKCLVAAVNLASSQTPFPLKVDPKQNATQVSRNVATETGKVVKNYVVANQQAKFINTAGSAPNPTSVSRNLVKSSGFLGSLGKALGAVFSIAQAYNSCAPS